MTLHLIHKHFGENHLNEVIDYMKKNGAPTLKAVDMGEDEYVILEGCHRARAAEILGLIPVIDEIEYSEEVLVCDIVDDYDNYDRTIADLCDSVYGKCFIDFEN